MSSTIAVHFGYQANPFDAMSQTDGIHWPAAAHDDMSTFDVSQHYNHVVPGTMAPASASTAYPSGSFSARHMHQTAGYAEGPFSIPMPTPQPWDGRPAIHDSFDNPPWIPTSDYQFSSISTTADMMDSRFGFYPLTVESPTSDGTDYNHQPGRNSLDCFSHTHTDYNYPELQLSNSPIESSSAGDFKCPLCGDRFVNQKNLDRHFLSERHNENAPKFTCACGYVQARKDNYRRHLQSCCFRIDSQYVYICSCGDRKLDKTPHLDHIDQCGRKRRGKQPAAR